MTYWYVLFNTNDIPVCTLSDPEGESEVTPMTNSVPAEFVMIYEGNLSM